MYIQELQAGVRVQILPMGNTDTLGFMCKVRGVSSRNMEVVTHAPMEKGEKIEMEQGSRFTLRIIGDNVIFQYNCIFIEALLMEGFHVTKFKLFDGGQRIQRRSSFRFECSLPVKFNIIVSDSDEPSTDDSQKEGLVVDVSAGGARIHANLELKVGDMLNLSLKLDDDEVITFGEVRMKRALDKGSKLAYQYGISFTMLSEKDQERIIRHMTKLQREKLKKANPR
ncbi:MAG: PilZ domain-containing protein [Defluviitaleaceae bacterium]|nr:PilZ domain-containing protein [Defluviitaleaceae bacterium]